jgi:NADPH-dependent curcumin reductase CurA
MKELGADVAFNYKTTDTAAVLAKQKPLDMRVFTVVDMNEVFDEVNVFRYWDNVAGPTLDHALHAANVDARFLVHFLPSIVQFPYAE